MWKNLLKNIAVSICSLIVFIGITEMICRLKYSPHNYRNDSLFEYDKKKVYRLKSNVKGYFAGIEDVSTNSFGCRDSEFSQEKSPRTYRILVVGDSISFGHGVLNNAVYPEVLELRLNSTMDQNSFEVINMAVPGYSAFQEYYDVKREMLFEPDMILLQFTLNDITEPYLFYKRYGGLGYIPTMPDIIDMSYFHHLLSQYSAFYLCLRDLISRIRFKTVSKKDIPQKAKELELYSVYNLVYQAHQPKIIAAWREYLTWLQKIIELSKRHHIPLLIIATPFEFQLFEKPELDYPQKILLEYCKENDIAVINLLPSLRSEAVNFIVQQKPELAKVDNVQVLKVMAEEYPELGHQFWETLFLDEDHPNTTGHHYIAELLYPIVREHIDSEY